MTSNQTFNCVFCKDSFNNKEDLQIHFRKHGDPKFNQTQKAKVRLQNETQSPTEKRSDEMEMVNCDVCTEVFPTISKAITHKHKVHPDHDAKYFCPWCGKLFTMKHLYNKHLQSNHMRTLPNNESVSDDPNFHCDACNVDFIVPSAMLYHNKFFHRQDTDLPSIGQSKKLKMVNQEVLQIFYCAFCGDEYDNKVNLHKHMADDHGDENQSPEDVLRCPLCEAIFYHLDAYELHLTFHSTDDLYSEKNDMFEQITEFSLETVSPMTEKIENIESQDPEIAMNAVGIDKFLEMAMDTAIDSGNGNDDDNPKKNKKHKKHKKSKKSAITLDEFLNMNKDVFGEGIDIQGVEEVPTQVVAKRLKISKATKLPTGKLKMMGNTNIEKLKQQGIVVKMKPTKKPIQTFKIGQKIPGRTLISKQIVNVASTSLKSPDEVLSRLLNQNNSQIKIVKKSTQERDSMEMDQSETSDVGNTEDRRPSSPEKIEVECDIMQSGYTSPETDAKEESGEKDKCNDSTIELEATISEKNENINKKLDSHNYSREFINENFESFSSKDVEDANENNKQVADQGGILNFKNIGIKSVSLPITQEESEETRACENQTEDMNDDCNNTENINKVSFTKNSLDALKHLSHLITIKPVALKENSLSSLHEDIFKTEDNLDLDNDNNENISLNQREGAFQTQQENKVSTIKPIEAFKNISKNITIKPFAHSPKQNVNAYDDIDHNEISIKSEDSDFLNQIKPTSCLKNLENQPQSPKPLLKVSNSPKPLNQPNKLEFTKNNTEKMEYQSNANLLKHLTNITAKPVSTGTKTVPMTLSRCKQIVGQVTHSKKEEPEQEIEIFNIDDSDSDDADKNSAAVALPPITKDIPIEKTSNKSFEKLKTINKNVTVKSLNQHSPQSFKNVSKQIIKEEVHHVKSQGSMSDFSDEDDDKNTRTTKNISNLPPKQNSQNLNICNTLKNLGKHITIKSRNSSPLSYVKSQDASNFKESETDAADSDNESLPGNVKISEINEESPSDEDMTEQVNKTECFEQDGNVNAQSPRESNSDTDHNLNDDTDGELSDLESQIQANKLMKSDLNIQKPKLEFKNVNKDLTIKSFNKSQETNAIIKKCNPTVPNNINKDLSIKPYKQIRKDYSNDCSQNKKGNTINVSQSTSQTVKQNVAANNQTSTVNKEVTVKTFQTKTIIQEITTTVTKTIKTVNQTFKQAVQGTSQTQPARFQKIQGMKSNQQIKNYQGVTVRHATPAAGTKIRGTAPFKLSPNTQVRPSNQLVPVRQTFNVVRTQNPRTTSIRKSVPTQKAKHLNNIGRPLKISPSAMNTIKRPTEDNIGHFSCFKKPKESLIPVDMLNFENSQGGESTVQFASSQRSNITSATKTVKGNMVVTQMKSEMNSSSQLSKLNHLSGLKVVKTSQSKQAVQVEEKCELSASKRNTLEAIEKLQKQGLLVKKPRYDTSNDSEHSNEEDRYITEEPDD